MQSLNPPYHRAFLEPMMSRLAANFTNNKLTHLNDFWEKIENEIYPDKLTFQDKIYLDYGFESDDQIRDHKNLYFLYETYSSKPAHIQQRFLKEILGVYQNIATENSRLIQPLSAYIDSLAGLSKSSATQHQFDYFKQMIKNIRFSIQSNILASHQTFQSHKPQSDLPHVSALDIEKYYQSCLLFDGECDYHREAILIPGDMKAFSFQDHEQSKTIYVFSRYGSNARKQVVDAMSHYHAMLSFRYDEELNEIIHRDFRNKQAFKKYFSHHYKKAMMFFNDLDRLDQKELEFCRTFIFPRPEKLFLPRKMDYLQQGSLFDEMVPIPTLDRHHVLNASILFNLGDHEGAEKSLEKAIEDNPKSKLIGRTLAFCKLLNGKESEATVILEQYLLNSDLDFHFIQYLTRGLMSDPIRIR